MLAALRVGVFAATVCLASSEGSDAAGELGLALPDLDFFMKVASDPLREFGEQAELLRKQVAQHEKDKQDDLVKMKASYEQNLTSQSHACDQIVEMNTKIYAAIVKEQDAIASLRQDAKKVQKSNDVMRASLEGLRPKMRLSSKFLNESLATTDDSNATELEVLRPTSPPPTLEHFLGSIREQSIGKHGHKVSLLGIDVRPTSRAVTLSTVKGDATTKASPEDLVGTLAHRLEDLAAAGDQGEAQLQARFLADHELGEKRMAELLAHKQKLEQDFEQKQQLHTQLKTVKKHLLDIRSKLEERVKGMRLFAMNGNDMAMAAVERAAELLKGSAQ